MNIVVCLKPVRDPLTVQFDMITEQLQGGEIVVNPLDWVALEAALRLRQEQGGEVVALTLGVPAVDHVMRAALLQGADRAMRVQVEQDILDHQQRAVVLATALAPLDYDLVLCGSRSADLEHAYVGTGIAQHLNLPTVSSVVQLACEALGQIRLLKKVERGQREVYTCVLPALVAVEEELCQPRYVPIMGRTYRAGLGKPIEVITLDDLDLSAPALPETPYATTVQRARPRTKGRATTGSFWDQMAAKQQPPQGAQPYSSQAIETCVTKLQEWLGGGDGG